MLLIVRDIWLHIMTHRSYVVTVTDLWLLSRRHDLRKTLGEDVGDLVVEHTTDALRDLENYGRSDNLGIKDLFAEISEEERLEQRIQTHRWTLVVK